MGPDVFVVPGRVRATLALLPLFLLYAEAFLQQHPPHILQTGPLASDELLVELFV